MDSSQNPTEPSGSQEPLETGSNPRPWSVTLLMLGVFIITGINLLRFVLSIKYWDFLAPRLGFSPLYMVLTGLIWTLAGAYLLWGLWRAKKWASLLMEAVALTYALYYWLDSIFLKDHPVSGATGAVRALLPANWQFSVGVTVVCLGFMAWTLGRSKVKAYFGPAVNKMERNDSDSDTRE